MQLQKRKGECAKLRQKTQETLGGVDYAQCWCCEGSSWCIDYDKREAQCVCCKRVRQVGSAQAESQEHLRILKEIRKEVQKVMLQQKIARKKAMRESEWALAVSQALRENIWLADSGASCHMGPSDDGMFDCEIINEPVTVGTGQTVKAVKIGKRRTTVCQADGSTLNTVLPIYKHDPDLTVNHFSVMT